MTLHILVEGASELAFFDEWGKRLRYPQQIRVHSHQGKGILPIGSVKANSKLRGLLDQLPFKLKAFEVALNPDADAILVLVDADNDDPAELIERISEVVQICAPSLRVKVSVATEETEAFYLGDLRALKRAYPDANMNLAREYIPDSICGTWEKFGEVVGDDGGNKVAWAEKMGAYVTTRPERSRSPSFKLMLRNISNLYPPVVKPVAKKKFYHRAKT